MAALSISLQRRMNGKSARFRASRMRLEMTMSDCGPDPRSHSPQRDASSSRLIVMARLRSEVPGSQCEGRGLWLVEAAEFIPQLGRPLVIFFLDRFFHLAADADAFR